MMYLHWEVARRRGWPDLAPRPLVGTQEMRDDQNYSQYVLWGEGVVWFGVVPWIAGERVGGCGWRVKREEGREAGKVGGSRWHVKR